MKTVNNSHNLVRITVKMGLQSFEKKINFVSLEDKPIRRTGICCLTVKTFLAIIGGVVAAIVLIALIVFLATGTMIPSKTTTTTILSTTSVKLPSTTTTTTPIITSTISPEKKVELDGKLVKAAKEGNWTAVESLLDEGANVNAIDKEKDKQNALFYACSGDLKNVEYLVEKGIDICAKTTNNATALHVAAHRNKLDIVEFLVKRGVDLNVKTDNGKTALDIARFVQFYDVADFLENVGGEYENKCSST